MTRVRPASMNTEPGAQIVGRERVSRSWFAGRLSDRIVKGGTENPSLRTFRVTAGAEIDVAARVSSSRPSMSSCTAMIAGDSRQRLDDGANRQQLVVDPPDER